MFKAKSKKYLHSYSPLHAASTGIPIKRMLQESLGNTDLHFVNKHPLTT